MKKSVLEQAFPAFNRDGVTGMLRISGNTNETSRASAESFADDLRRRAAYPLSESPALQEALAKCLMHYPVGKESGNKHALRVIHQLNSNRTAPVIIGLLALVSTLWLGCWMEHAANQAFDRHIKAIGQAMQE